MALKSIQLATITPVNRRESKFQVDVHSDDGRQCATFSCSSEHDAIALRNAIRDHADSLARVVDFDRK